MQITQQSSPKLGQAMLQQSLTSGPPHPAEIDAQHLQGADANKVTDITMWYILPQLHFSRSLAAHEESIFTSVFGGCFGHLKEKGLLCQEHTFC